MAVFAAACTSETGPTASTVTSRPTNSTEQGSTGEAPLTMADFLGGDQTVQDFVLHIDLAVQREDETTSVYPEVLERARAGAEGSVDLAGGFQFSAVTNIEGTVVDESGDQLPHLSVDFGLMIPSQDVLDQTVSGGSTELVELFDGVGPETSGMLVEIVSADFSSNREHIGPGDRTSVDMTFLDGVAPGDELTSVHVFGQTLPGDPSVEEGLSAQELFTYRWNQGLVNVLGDENGVSVVADGTVTAVQGSTLVTREEKAALVFAAGLRVQLQSGRATADFLDGKGDTAVALYLPGTDINDAQVEFLRDSSGQTIGLGLCYPTKEGRPCQQISRDQAAMLIITKDVLLVCSTIAAYLNQRNESGGIPRSELAQLGFEVPPPNGASTTTTVAPGSSTTIASPASSSTTNPTPPGPVSCDPPTKPPDSPSPIPTGGTLGDVHMWTFDGMPYDNQAAGEFLVFEDETVSIQMRTEPVAGSTIASVATAIAVSTGEHQISMHVGDTTWIDGELADLRRGEVIRVGDAELLWGLPGWVIVSPDGTVVRVKSFTSNLMLVVNTSSPSRGMLGDNDGDPENDLVTRSGTQLASNADDDFNTFYATYIDSWRIADDESMFHYEPGETTQAFSITGFPSGPSSIDLLEATMRDVATEICIKLGLTRGRMQENCILDVGLTDDPSFAYQSAVFQLSVTEATAVEPAPTGPPGDGTSYIQMGSTLIQFGAEPPVRDPNGFSPQWTCGAEDGIFTVSTRFPETPTRTIKIEFQYLDAATSRLGEDEFYIVVRINDNPYAWVQTFAEQFANAIENIDYDGTTLNVSGALYVSDTPDPSVFPGRPEGAALTPFVLRASCS